MSVHNADIARVFDVIADLLEAVQAHLGKARRGWLETKDVLNCRPLAELRRLLGVRRERSARSGVE